MTHGLTVPAGFLLIRVGHFLLVSKLIHQEPCWGSQGPAEKYHLLLNPLLLLLALAA